MVDSVQIWPPGLRLTDGDGAVLPGGYVTFFDAGTTTPKEMFSDKGLSVSLGSIIYTRSDGLPVASEGSTTTVTVYTDTEDYKYQVFDQDDVSVVPVKDNVRGALDTSDFLTSESTSTFSLPVINRTTDLVVTTTHRGKLINCNATGGDITLTVDNAATLGDGWSVFLANAGASGEVLISFSQAMAIAGITVTRYAMQPGEKLSITCDGTAFKEFGGDPPFMRSRAPGIITIVDRVSSAPVSPTPGARYIVTSTFSGYAAESIIEYNGSDYTEYAPAADCGWLAYVQDEDTLYAFVATGWMCLTATQALAEGGSNNITYMTPLRTRQALPARAYAEYTTNAAITTPFIPADDTIPQNTEGTEIVTASITLKSASSRVRVRFSGVAYTGTDDIDQICAALFLNNDANAYAVSFWKESGDSAGDHNWPLVIDFEHAPGAGGSHTYKIRVGPPSGSMRMNGEGSRLYGGVARSVLILEEVLT